MKIKAIQGKVEKYRRLSKYVRNIENIGALRGLILKERHIFRIPESENPIFSS